MIQSDNFEVLEAAEGKGTKYEVLAYKKIVGGSRLADAANLVYMQKAGIYYQQVRVILENAKIRTEAGALHFMRGKIELDSDLGSLGSFFKKGLTAMASGEAIVKPVYNGTGEIFLEPSFGHYLLVKLEESALICDDGVFLACDETVEVTAEVQKSLVAGLFGGEGFVQPKLIGTGICLLKSPIPGDELIKVELENDTLQVDGSFALCRIGDIEFSLERSTKSLMGSMTSGEGVLQTFRGTGEVWLNPLESMYR
ncbi:AIM24 family protein [Candidatus Riflebacteria bacterium]